MSRNGCYPFFGDSIRLGLSCEINYLNVFICHEGETTPEKLYYNQEDSLILLLKLDFLSEKSDVSKTSDFLKSSTTKWERNVNNNLWNKN